MLQKSSYPTVLWTLLLSLEMKGWKRRGYHHISPPFNRLWYCPTFWVEIHFGEAPKSHGQSSSKSEGVVRLTNCARSFPKNSPISIRKKRIHTTIENHVTVGIPLHGSCQVTHRRVVCDNVFLTPRCSYNESPIRSNHFFWLAAWVWSRAERPSVSEAKLPSGMYRIGFNAKQKSITN